LKVFVFDKVEGEAPGVPTAFGDNNIPVDVEHLPVQVVRAAAKKGGKSSKKGAAQKRRSNQKGDTGEAQTADAQTAVAAAGADAGVAPVLVPQALLPQRERRRPVVGGISISPLNVSFVGTLGCFLLRQNVDTEEVFALSNNHVLANVDRLPVGTRIVQPGPEQPPFLTDPQDTFANLHTVIPIRFPDSGADPVFNRFDAAMASVSNAQLIERGRMFGMLRADEPNPGSQPVYDPSRVVAPEPQMRVMKMGRTTGFTRGMITATNVQGVQVNYGTQQFPRIAVFRGVLTIVGDDGPFSMPGDSGSVILEESTGHPVALLFAGDGVRTTACDLGALCQQLGAWPV
ncbi:MAG TPA: hypothetical protein VGV38_02545, partial [Pyrinomonadaceae bacterium]|nr:hypothetical protein [Pyrinomonadaceae bacterium]